MTRLGEFMDATRSAVLTVILGVAFAGWLLSGRPPRAPK